ncbi:MAG: hypothetical protein GQ565_06095 [Candidatus Aegiribacteria sp.]|nr:hypothetical protein [Candidatus Aegiribacteria sp.]
MRQIAFLALMMLVAGVYGQPDEEVTLIPDSIEVTEEVEIQAEDTSTIPDSIEVTEEAEIPAEDAPPLTITIPNDPSTVLQVFFQALKTGDRFMISQLISSEGLDEIDIMLEILKENLDNATLSRLTTAGYTVTADEIDDWSPMDYLTCTIALPVMKSRYAFYEMQIGDYSSQGNKLIIPMVFTTASGVELSSQGVLLKEGNQWKVTKFMGLNSFP